MSIARSLATASAVVEEIASQNSSSIFVYDLAEHAAFGRLSEQLTDANGGANVVRLQTRAGAGLSLVGRISAEGSSKDVQKDSVLSAYTTPSGVTAMAASFAHLPKPTPFSRVVIQVPTVTPLSQTLQLSPTLALLSPILTALPDSFTVLLSATPQEIVDLAAAAYRITDSHVVHLFNHHSAGREVGHNLIKPHPVGESHDRLKTKDALNAAGYAFFDYIGDTYASKVLVVLNGPLASAAQHIAKNRPGFGVIVVRVLRPWDDVAFIAALPKTARFIHVLTEVQTEGTHGPLYLDVLAATLGLDGSKPAVRAVRVVPTRMQEFIMRPSSFVSFLDGLAPITSPPVVVDRRANQKKLLFFGTPSGSLASLPGLVTNTFIANKALEIRALTDRDMLSKPGGITVTRILLSQKGEIEDYVPLPIHLPLDYEEQEELKADFVAVFDQSLLKSHTILSYIKSNATVLLFATWTNTEVLANLPQEVSSLLRDRHVKLYTVNLKSLRVDASTENIIGHLAFLRLYLAPYANEALLRRLAHGLYGRSNVELSIDKINAKAWSALVEVNLDVSQEPSADESKVDLKPFQFNAIDGIVELDQSSLPGAHISSWHEAARRILFSDALAPESQAPADEYPRLPSLRPELPERTYLVTCTVNRRLTPLDYDRNVFHLEFDTAGTGLKYAIGEALGVHGWNDTNEVLDFCEWYGVDPDRLITLPVPGAEGKVHTRTIFQVLQQQIDLFGKPPKSFYTELANYATSKNDKLTLQFIGSQEGSSMFKKLSEKETVTFADILRTYNSARPSIEVLCEMIGDIKPRHYSIASAQSVVGDRVDLLVVTVEWTAPSGSPRFGQCTRYLASLKVGQKVTVSIKPSVMKLPPSDLQPLILAGLGTGAAPFRAFLQHRALLASQGKPVGPLYYYFGSRYCSKEYLYGEELEAYMLDGTITRAGLAFSRDGPKKVYIQHKMLEDAEDLVRMLHREKGVFYLCGPTWPVPDVYETLVKALVKYNGLAETEAAEYLERLKEEERYVLEVY